MMIFHPRRTSHAAITIIFTTIAVGALALPPGTNEEIYERIKPAGHLNLPAPKAPDLAMATTDAMRSGEEIYNSYCVACHQPATAAALGSPAYGDAKTWAPRIAKGIEVLYESTYQGLNGVMPVRGTCMDCSDEELAATVDYMLDALPD